MYHEKDSVSLSSEAAPGFEVSTLVYNDESAISTNATLLKRVGVSR